MAPGMVSETDMQAARLALLRDAPPVVVLRDGLLPLQAARSAAYGRLNGALRDALGGRRGYELICADCTEDFKVASEGVLALRGACAGRPGMDDVVRMMDRLQELEERKLAAVVSVHAVKRARKEGGDEAVVRVVGGEEGVDERLVRYARVLNGIDEGIEEVVSEAREIVFDAEEEEREE